jgi:uncharacterized protein YbaR (Trm112 family)
MISQHLLDILRCPMDPGRQARLNPEGGLLICEACGLRFPIRDGFPVLVVEEAQLPPSCDSLEQIAARHPAKS